MKIIKKEEGAKLSLKLKLFTCLSLAVVLICVFIVGVMAATKEKVLIDGSIVFVVDDQSLYVRDVRVQQDFSEKQQTVPGFTDGFINDEFHVDLTTVQSSNNSTGTIAIYFDVINLLVDDTSSNYVAEAAWTNSPVQGVSFELIDGSQYIAAPTVPPDELSDSTPLSGTIILMINVTTNKTFSMSNITITIREP